MNLPAIICSDLHLTSNPDDEYRWGLFQWLAKQIVAEKAKTLLILGDLTDAKDYHSSELVNRVVKAIEILSWLGCRIIILRGNHDYLRGGHMFFEFLSAIKGVEVITQRTCDDTVDHLTMYLPFTRTPAEDWKGLDFSHYRYLFMHQTVTGSIASNGQKMDGEPLPPLNAGKVYSGDIHVPQTIGEVEYVGSPYHVHFGDNFKPRCIALDHDGKAFDLHFPAPRRVMIDAVDWHSFKAATEPLQASDQVKVRLALPEREKHLWRAIKADVEGFCKAEKLQLVEISLKVQRSQDRVKAGDRPVALFDPVQAAYKYVDDRDLGPELLDAALECMQT